MENKPVLKKYYSRLSIEGIIKSLICGLIVGFALSIIPSVIGLQYNFSGLWLALLVVALTAAIVTPICYKLFFTPNVKQIAERIDRLGLEERMITMMELENDDSYMAMIQREDAQQKLRQVNDASLRFSIFKIPLVLMFMLMICSVTMITVSALSVEGKIHWEGKGETPTIDVPRPEDEDYTYISVEYVIVQGSGYIDGDSYQVIVSGTDASPVLAVPFEGWAFLDWFDTLGGTSEKPGRTDTALTEDFVAFVRFVPQSDDESDPEPQPDPPPSEDPTPVFDPNLVIDGSVKYLENGVYERYYEYVMALLAEGREVPEELMRLVQLYFEAIA